MWMTPARNPFSSLQRTALTEVRGAVFCEKLISQARMVLSMTAYHWLHPSALAAQGHALRSASAEWRHTLRGFQAAARRILALGAARSPFSKPARRLRRKAAVTRRALSLRIGPSFPAQE